MMWTSLLFSGTIGTLEENNQALLSGGSKSGWKKRTYKAKYNYYAH